MSEHSEDKNAPILGRPVQTPRPASDQKVSADAPRKIQEAPVLHSSEAVDASSGRPGDSTIGRPIQAPKEFKRSELTQTDLEIRQEQEQREKSLALFYQSPRYEVPQFFTQALFFLVGTLAVVVGVFLVVEVIQLVAVLNTLPVAFQIVAYTLLFVLFVITASTVWQWAMVWRRLQVNQQIQITKVAADSRHLSPEVRGAARKQLQSYLRSYDLSPQSSLYLQFRALGFEPDALKRLEESRQRLLLETRPISSKEWIDEFQQDWLAVLDAKARVRINRYAKFVALKTAIIPYRLLDVLSVLYNNFRMLQDLCLLFQVRTGKFGTVYLLGLCIFHAFIAGAMNEAIEAVDAMLEEGGENAGDTVVDSMADASPELVGEVASEGILSGVGKQYLGKAAEGMANGFFLRRIGRQAIRLLQPLA